MGTAKKKKSKLHKSKPSKKTMSIKDDLKTILLRNKELQKEINTTNKKIVQLEKESLRLTKLLIEKGYKH